MPQTSLSQLEHFPIDLLLLHCLTLQDFFLPVIDFLRFLTGMGGNGQFFKNFYMISAPITKIEFFRVHTRNNYNILLQFKKLED